ncbi:MAG: hypothetical protein BAJALOKI2v1_50011 [Promethearchaeota archaeon]|nr:MAG: hypothetical protein BAJALOKI2v1_50011 [Candidatus Lokiarchaeota archaeon]
MTLKSIHIEDTDLQIEVKEVRKVSKIRYALKKLIYVPDADLKPKIITKILTHIRNIIENKVKEREEKDHEIGIFIAYKGKFIKGMVIAEDNPHYSSRNRRAASFGWLYAKDYEVCKELMEACESFARKRGKKLLRGPINFPKSVGGYGLQVEGFDEQLIYGVAFNDPKTAPSLKEFLEDLNYKQDSEYLSMEVTQDRWKSGTQLDKDIKIRYLTFEELNNRKDEILDILRGAFYSVLPDAFGMERYKEIMDLLRNIPSHYYKLPKKIKLENDSVQTEFVEAWKKCYDREVITFFHLAFDKNTDNLVGIITCLPDLYELWKDNPITRVNVDVAAVRKGYGRKGIFSSLNNIGQLTGNMLGITYYEGTSIWNLNEDAIRTILPHGRINRRFYVFQKRIKNPT